MTLRTTDLAERLLDHHQPDDPDGRLLCAACRAPITHEQHRIDVDGGHVHRHANPHGIEFEIGCFAQARGVHTHGRPTAEHTWFKRHTWVLALCRQCSEHLGWTFQGRRPERFHGLILERLIRLD